MSMPSCRALHSPCRGELANQADPSTRGLPMPSGLIALLDDVALIAKLASASIDDVAGATAQGRHQGGRRGDRRYGGDPALRPWPDPGPRAADHRQDHARLLEKQIADPAAGGADRWRASRHGR